MTYLGNTPTTQAFTQAVDYFSGNGSTTAFTLSRSVASSISVEAVCDNVQQNPATAYSVLGNTITFTSAPLAGTNNIYVIYQTPIVQIIQPSQGTVNDQQLGVITKLPLVAGTLGAGNASLMKNRIINGAMVIDQRNAGSSGTAGGYTVDRWLFSASQSNKLTWGQNLNSATPFVGFTNYLGIQSSSAYSITSTDYFEIDQPIEGFNVADLGWGTANAKPITLSFVVRSSLTGTFGGAIRNQAVTRSYPFSYSIPVANVDTVISIQIAGDTTGTWVTNNGIGMYVQFGLGVGSTYSGTAGSWQAGNYHSATGAVSVVGTSGATFYITGVQLEVGSVATGFEYEIYSQTLAKCQRYYQKQQVYQYASVDTTNTVVGGTYVPKRVTPTISVTSNIALAGTVVGLDGWCGYSSGQTNSQFISQVISSAEL